ncbi:MAG: alkaline phosphatase D family protein, partial [Novipirellula sp. JB048]
APYQLKLTAIDRHGTELGRNSTSVVAERIHGNVALVNNFGKVKPMRRRTGGSRYRFHQWRASGPAFTVTPSHRFGPLLWTMYSLSDSRSEEGFVLKLSALTGPLGAQDNHEVELLVERGGQWSSLGTATLDPDAWTATFRIPHWDATTAVPYKAVYYETHPSGAVTESSWSGVIQANPSGRPLRMAALTCQKDYGFPYAPVAQNLLKLKPDLVYFSGDQLYEDHGGFGFIREPAELAILNYLRKYYMHGWAFREVMKDAPTLCLPDDHDVFHGNLWGESGAPMRVQDNGTSSYGGYREPARMVNVVHTTTVGHHPDYHDPTPVKQGISVYYGDMVYGDVSFAIIADRQFKSGPEHVDTGEGRADHVSDPDFDTTTLDKPGLVLLGERQEDFLKQWAEDWRGHTMKVLLSQTVFAGVATHHGNTAEYLKADLDSGAWPQTARNRAIRICRPGMPLHINGDQHLTSLSQYGVDRQRDSFWSFCTPAISAGYPRWWRPDEMGIPHQNRPKHGLANTGEYTDGFGNLVYVYAVGNPEPASKKHRYDLAHQKGSGFGMVTIDTEAKTYHLESFRFLIDVSDGRASNQFPGWPVTIHQAENAGQNRS